MPAARRPRPIVLGELRPSQIITTFGPGAVIDQPTASLIIAGTDYWTVTDDQRIDEPRLRGLLRVRSLYRPRVRSDRPMGGIPAFVFPRYLVCPRCQRLATVENFHFDGRHFRCRNRRGHPNQARDAPAPRAFPARFVVACAAGHLDDFPWSGYVHRGRGSNCDPLELTFFESNESGAISDVFVHCRACRATRPMEAAFEENAERALGQCTGARPWLDDHEQACGERLRTVLRGASNLYFPIIQSALSIPEWDDPIHLAIAHHEEDLERIDSWEKLRAALDLGVLARLRNYSADDIWKALQSRRSVDDEPPYARYVGADWRWWAFEDAPTLRSSRRDASRRVASLRVLPLAPEWRRRGNFGRIRPGRVGQAPGRIPRCRAETPTQPDLRRRGESSSQAVGRRSVTGSQSSGMSPLATR